MNPDIILRALQRHRHMDDATAYEALLVHARDRGNVWFAPQGEVAAWWERRHEARLAFEAMPGELRIRSGLESGVIEIDRQRIVDREFEVPWEGNSVNLPVASPGAGGRALLAELLAHLGYGHVTIGGPEQEGVLGDALWLEQLATLDESARVHQRFAPEALDRVRDLIGKAHRESGMPDVRIWPWPHQEGRSFEVVLSPRYDVDKAIVNLPMIHDLESKYGARSTVYLRPFGMFYGEREIRRCRSAERGHEIGLHGEFVSTAEAHFDTEERAAVEERERLAEVTGEEVLGVCMHGGELRTNSTPGTRDAVERAGYLYETMYRNRYYFPLHVPGPEGFRKTLSIGQHFADISVPLGPEFSSVLERNFIEQFDAAAAVNGMFVPVMHPLYFGVGHYLRYPMNVARIAVFLPKFVYTAARMRRGQHYSNR